MESFDLLQSLTPERIVAASKLAMSLPHYTWREVVPGDDTINVGTIVTSPNEKYFRLMTDQPLDVCLTRAAVRNLRMYVEGIDPELMKNFKALPPTVPDEIIEWFKQADAKGQFKDVVLS